MELLIVAVFVAGYILIALEHPIRINKTATALLTGVICWTIFILSGPTESLLHSTEYSDLAESLSHGSSGATGDMEVHREYVIHSLREHLAEIAEILFFLIGAMTIVELVDSHRGFKFITDRIRTTNARTLLWVICWVTFILSAILDNLTTTIVMVSLTRKLVPNRDTRLFFAGLIVVAANAGGAWSPIGDVTTTMLWIGGQITAVSIVKSLIIPSIVCMLIPLLVLSFTMKGTLGEGKAPGSDEKAPPTANLMLAVGVSALVSVPIFKTLTHLPPYLGMMLGLSVLWVVSEFANRDLDDSQKGHFTAIHALSRIDMPSVLFFLGILLAVASLQSMHLLQDFAIYLNDTIGDNRVIITLIGMLSAIVDNVPLVAASMGMYSMDIYPTDHLIWEYLAYCAGTGGSLLVIGSAAGVAAMGMEKIDFIWYVKRITLLAAVGYFAGAATYLFLTHQ
jgi:Na+/H+ antiporter NhaD/arsenite permease-like protein|nr:MAG: sodium:proton antiporter [Bacteroidota bacterium]